MLKAVENNNTQSKPRLDEVIKIYLEARKARENIQAMQRKKLAPLNMTIEKIEGWLDNEMNESGQKSAKTAAGTVTVRVIPSAVCTDPNMFVDFVRENDLYELMDRKANATACQDYANEHDGQLPPGVRINRKRTIVVTPA